VFVVGAHHHLGGDVHPSPLIVHKWWLWSWVVAVIGGGGKLLSSSGPGARNDVVQRVTVNVACPDDLLACNISRCHSLLSLRVVVVVGSRRRLWRVVVISHYC
jgi:hypothetical protein